MPLVVVPPNFVDWAWRDGASSLCEPCSTVEDITGDQLKLILSRGERTLVRMDKDDKTVGWGAFRVDQLPNLRVLHITDLVSHNGEFHTFFDEIKDIAKNLGCIEVRCSCKPVQARLFKQTNGFEEVFTTLRVRL